ncbi:helix-turn-helix transcriptional regulator [Streptomyces sp. NBC_01474]|uniref:helix-turn-helix domain-containing protein n=1 Tax=unclassified Streptomyces TaxID=2593676 RepID=UPI002DDA1A9F|nr:MULTISPECIES: helix-turn-helix domain-containing protein [unclassified Streptomyces]WSD94637.1 helix-turn-helix transcriptional regulator [Streptomyces sp. NBC_01474]
MLQVLGIDSESESVYASLLTNRPVSLDDLAGITGLAPARVRMALRRLQSSGLAGRRPGRPVTYVAIDPEVALDGLLLRRQEELHKARVRAGEFSERFRRAAATRDPAEVIEIVTGAASVLQRSEQLMRNVRHQLRVFDKPPYLDGRDPNQPELDLLSHGVIIRGVYDADSIDVPGRQELVRMWTEAGEQARVLADVPTKMALVDDRLALMPLRAGAGPDPSPSFVILHRSAVLDALSALFEALWVVAQPLHPQGSDDDSQALSEEDRLLISLLTAGLPDEAIARQADLSYRTLQRRMHVLMERAGASTRFQLGIHAAANGWVTGVELGREPHPEGDRLVPAVRP